MSLIRCEECNHEVSNKAKVCPNCGCPLIIVESIEHSNLDIPAEDTSNESNESNESMETTKKGKEKKGIIITLILCIILISFGGFVVLNNSVQEDIMRGMKFGMTYNEVKAKEREKSPIASLTDKEDYLGFFCDDSYYFPGEDLYLDYSFVDGKLDTISYVTNSGVSADYLGRVYRKIVDKYGKVDKNGEKTYEKKYKMLVFIWEMEDKRISLIAEEAEFGDDYKLYLSISSEGY